MSIKSLTAAVAAATIAGTVGMAYAQTTTNNNPDSGRALPVQSDAKPVIQTTPSTDTSAPATDVAPKADRN